MRGGIIHGPGRLASDRVWGGIIHGPGEPGDRWGMRGGRIHDPGSLISDRARVCPQGFRVQGGVGRLRRDGVRWCGRFQGGRLQGCGAFGVKMERAFPEVLKFRLVERLRKPGTQYGWFFQPGGA
eukprot:366341-Chlamydomonas_euryale.AAC.31